MKSIVTKLKQLNLTTGLFLKPTAVAVDIGTAMTRFGLDEKGIVLREPTFVGKNTRTGQILFFGNEAKDIYGKSPEYVSIIKPFENSIISDFDATVALISELLKKSIYPYYRSHLIKKGLAAYATVPTNSTEVEQRALQEALIKAGFQHAYLLEKPIASAYGADVPIFFYQPAFVMDFGAGTVELAVITMGGIVASKVLKLGGDYMDKLIYNYLHLKYGLVVGEQTAENLKNKLFALTDSKEVFPVRGKSLENGLPKSVRVTASDIREALAVCVNQIVDGIKELIETIPPEIIDGLIKSGIVLTGKMAHTPGLDKYISNEVKLPVIKARKPEDATILGIMKLVSEPESLKRVIIYS
ncbi:MAG: Rod shape-determining protein MreB [Microgenomates bacterium OLB23]|nr:MAG: Rod shape-determining protein MreB [Microgenomates bacterium OLB23]